MDISEEEWKRRLPEEQYRILREKKTEAPFSGKYHDCKSRGIYHCAGCNQPLFSSEDKFDSGTGWPSFTQPIDKKNLSYKKDHTLLSTRTEALCSNCQGHLGHVFNDGPPPKGQRYCINSAALNLQRSP